MKQRRHQYDAKFKVRVVLDAIRERETLNELAAKYELSPVIICRWKKEFLANSNMVFEKSATNSNVSMDKERDKYLRKIGSLEMQLDFAKRVSKELGIEIPAED